MLMIQHVDHAATRIKYVAPLLADICFSDYLERTHADTMIVRSTARATNVVDLVTADMAMDCWAVILSFMVFVVRVVAAFRPAAPETSFPVVGIDARAEAASKCCSMLKTTMDALMNWFVVAVRIYSLVIVIQNLEGELCCCDNGDNYRFVMMLFD
jgi:hypothetical protein